jgi:hypothetical protein
LPVSCAESARNPGVADFAPGKLRKTAARKNPFTRGGQAMPFGDRTGPRGLGPMTGKGLGWCAGAQPGDRFGGYQGRAGALGWGLGRGRRHGFHGMGAPGRGWAGRGWSGASGYAPGPAQSELEYLREYTKGLEEALNATKARMAEIEKASSTE